MLYVFRDQNTWITALCLGYVEWVARSVNQRIAWTEDDQGMRQTIRALSQACTEPHRTLLNDIINNTHVSLVFPSIEIKESILNLSDPSLWKWLTKDAWAGDIPYSGNVLLPEEFVELVAALSKEWHPNTVLDLYSGDGRFLNGICEAIPGITATGMEPDPILALLTKIAFALRNGNVAIQNKHVFHACLTSDYDLVFARFPFAEKPYADIQKDKDSKVSFLNCKLKADYSYVAKAVNAVSSSGRAIILISENSLYNNIDKEYRQELIEKGLIETIITLPQGILPNTSIHYSLMILSSDNSAINIVDGRECTIDHGRHKSLDVKQILEIVRWKQDRYALVRYDDIKKGTILSAARYFQEDIKLINPVPLCKIGTSYRGYQYNAKLQEEGEPGEKEYGLLKLSDIGTETIDFDSLATFDGDKHKMKRYVLQENDIVLTARGPIYKVALIKDIGDRKIIPSSNLMVIRPDPGSIIPEYLYLFLISETGKACIHQIQTGDVILVISHSNLQNMPVPVIDKNKQKQSADSYKVMRLRMQQLQEALDQIQDTINHLYEQTANDGGESDG